MKKTIKIASAAICLGATISSASAAIVIHGSSTAYTETGGDWLSMGTNDIDVSGGLGTDGFSFFSKSTVASDPAYVTSLAVASTAGLVATNSAYAAIDDPTLLDGTDGNSGFISATGGAAGTDNDLVTFTISGLEAGQTVRIGLLGGTQTAANGRWDATSYTLSDGTSSATVGDHTTSPLTSAPDGTAASAGWVFFDLDSDGNYTVSGTKRLNTQGSSLAGITFDSIVVPEPSSTALLGLGALSLILRRRK